MVNELRDAFVELDPDDGLHARRRVFAKHRVLWLGDLLEVSLIGASPGKVFGFEGTGRGLVCTDAVLVLVLRGLVARARQAEA